MRVLKTPNIRPGHCFVVEDGVLVVDGGRLADLVRTDGDDTDIYPHPADAPGFSRGGSSATSPTAGG